MAVSKLAVAFSGVLLTLTACSQEAEPVDPPAVAQDGLPGVEITDARMILPAIPGDPAVVYFNLANGSQDTLTIRRIDVEGSGRAELHETAEVNGEMQMGEAIPFHIEPGDGVSLQPGGRHVMVFDVADDVASAGQTEVTLTMLGGDKHSFAVPVRAAGEDR